jgi:GT2 family glycosyltransferase
LHSGFCFVILSGFAACSETEAAAGMDMPDTPPQFLSVVIPTYRRPHELAACLASLARLDYPRSSFEVVVVDDGSPAPLDAVVAPFKETLDVRLFRQDNAGPAAARNAGAAHARGTCLVFLDDDCAPAPDYLRILAARAAQAPGSAVGGRTVNALTRNLFSTASQRLADYLYAYFNADQSNARFLTSNNMLVPANIFRELNGFDTTFRLAAFEDRDLCERIVARGHHILYAPEAVIYHAHRMTLRQYWRQHFTYGRGAATFHTKRSDATSGPRLPSPASFYLNLVRYPFSQPSESPAIVIATLLVVSQVATSAGFFRERLARWWQRGD